MAEIIWSKCALEDLRSIFDFIARDSLQYANKQVDRIIERVNILHKFQKAGRVVPEFENDSIRELLEGQYRIVYEIFPNNLISIISIHHSSKLLV